jgi:hypothetical protein
MSYIADRIVCDTPADRLEGAEAYRGFQGPFVEILTARWRKIFTGNMIRGGSCGDQPPATSTAVSSSCAHRVPSANPTLLLIQTGPSYSGSDSCTTARL